MRGPIAFTRSCHAVSSLFCAAVAVPPACARSERLLFSANRSIPAWILRPDRSSRGLIVRPRSHRSSRGLSVQARSDLPLRMAWALHVFFTFLFCPTLLRCLEDAGGTQLGLRPKRDHLGWMAGDWPRGEKFIVTINALCIYWQHPSHIPSSCFCFTGSFFWAAAMVARKKASAAWRGVSRTSGIISISTSIRVQLEKATKSF